MKVELSFDRYYDYEELTTALEDLQAAYPDLMQLESLGKTPQGRNIWAVTITGPAKPADTKPGYLIDASHHAGEVTGTMTAIFMAGSQTTAESSYFFEDIILMAT